MHLGPMHSDVSAERFERAVDKGLMTTVQGDAMLTAKGGITLIN